MIDTALWKAAMLGKSIYGIIILLYFCFCISLRYFSAMTHLLRESFILSWARMLEGNQCHSPVVLMVVMVINS